MLPTDRPLKRTTALMQKHPEIAPWIKLETFWDRNLCKKTITLTPWQAYTYLLATIIFVRGIHRLSELPPPHPYPKMPVNRRLDVTLLLASPLTQMCTYIIDVHIFILAWFPNTKQLNNQICQIQMIAVLNKISQITRCVLANHHKINSSASPFTSIVWL